MDLWGNFFWLLSKIIDWHIQLESEVSQCPMGDGMTRFDAHNCFPGELLHSALTLTTLGQALIIDLKDYCISLLHALSGSNLCLLQTLSLQPHQATAHPTSGKMERKTKKQNE